MSAQGEQSYMINQIHNPLLRRVYEDMIDDANEEDKFDANQWYDININKIDRNLQSACIKSNMDQPTREFIDNCSDASIVKDIFNSITSSFLHLFLSKTTSNGLLGRGSMYLYSHQQLIDLLQVQLNWRVNNWLDIGAGDGCITSVMAELADQVYVTEVSSTMLWRLKHRGYKCIDAYRWHETCDEPFDVISCLNVLDRIDRPISLLSNIKKCLKPESGILIAAVVVPVECFVESGWFASNQPSERLTVQGSNFEQSVNSLVNDVFKPAGFTVVNFTRLPYLCQGDLHKHYYVLDDAVFVLRVSDHA